MRLRKIIELAAVLVFWAAVIFGALQTKSLVSASDYSVCGPWGCGPTSDALLAVHLGWFALIVPPTIYIPLRLHLTGKFIVRFSLLLLAGSVAGLLAIIAWQWFVWLPRAGVSWKPYIWQRCGFAIATSIDLPFSQIALAALSLLSVHGLHRYSRERKPRYSRGKANSDHRISS